MNKINIYLLSLGAFLTGTAELVFAGILHIVAEDINISTGLAGQLITSYSLAFAIGTPIVIPLTYRIKRKSILVYSLALFVTGCLLCFMSSQYAILMISRLIMGLSAGVFTVVSLSSAVKLVPKDKTGSAISMIVLGVSAAMVLGVPIGVTITSLWNWQIIFLLLGLLSLPIMILIIRLFPKVEGDAPVSFKQQFVVLGSFIIVSGFFFSLFLSTSNSTLYSYIAPFFNDILQLSTSHISIILFVMGIFGVIGSRLGGFGVDKWGTIRMISYGLATHALMLALIATFSFSVVGGMMLIIVWVFSMFTTVPAIQTFFVQQAPQSSNLVLGLNTSIMHLGVAIGAGIGGFAIESTETVLFNPWIASGIALLSFIMAMMTFSRLRLKKA